MYVIAIVIRGIVRTLVWYSTVTIRFKPVKAEQVTEQPVVVGKSDGGHHHQNPIENFIFLHHTDTHSTAINFNIPPQLQPIQHFGCAIGHRGFLEDPHPQPGHNTKPLPLQLVPHEHSHTHKIKIIRHNTYLAYIKARQTSIFSRIFKSCDPANCPIGNSIPLDTVSNVTVIAQRFAQAGTNLNETLKPGTQLHHGRHGRCNNIRCSSRRIERTKCVNGSQKERSFTTIPRGRRLETAKDLRQNSQWNK